MRASRRRSQLALISSSRITGIVKRSLPNATVAYFERLGEGASNLNYLVRLAGCKADWIVLRIFTREPLACRKELELLRCASLVLPVPEVIHADAEGYDDVGPYVLYRFAQGITFHRLKSGGSAQDLAKAAHAIGATAACIGMIKPPLSIPARAVFVSGFLGRMPYIAASSKAFGQPVDGPLY